VKKSYVDTTLNRGRDQGPEVEFTLVLAQVGKTIITDIILMTLKNGGQMSNHNMTQKNKPNSEEENEKYWADVIKICEEKGLNYDWASERMAAMDLLDGGYEIDKR